ncbi:phytanoyl-CoA dioxygenase family protein [Streptomyces stelliscabiei]|uniref:phytanoyl-CoA dioxygenase family protein n=1 Tax=Streptomyces stelliscabiei TaxID=146820 RepID=UPI0029B2A1A7|nr:phytanoyl-CoA dioxygenase family protein [Streptomyces stelliscabiei]MDX2611819.1 phytanoyl-CoA dioxygenase family protein [Streptomyces stelliscabiei]MDX2637167.1 phytanoyl-CoA dioxygenase family protein [Streptomyces stelliscabiei]MDX2660585.1 phytanoyl-CoA dioxygenase family protein [Streptomyces stelliscabiei]MDX2714899.1 phytanoyl-CoA dioxygenase family protein [Streptomyces stelliscabiei]MDX2789179.1 phytanoyl-CoA dioxygenase family protein [Streptomyces stelliscabiei]
MAATGRAEFEENGFLVARGLFTSAEIAKLCDRFTALREGGPIPGHFRPRTPAADGPADPLDTHPRVMQPHRIDELSLRVLLDARLRVVLEGLLGEEVLAAQSMFYFKAPGARGQALHQDNFYLRVEPGTCVAAWIACDVIDRANGGLEVVPGTHRMDLFCPEVADAEVSFVREYVPPPPGLSAVPVDMAPGDVLFFNGSLVHGSQPNRTTDSFRRSFIGHYVGRSTERIGRYYDVLTMTGAPVPLAESEGAGPCGTEFAPMGAH